MNSFHSSKTRLLDVAINIALVILSILCYILLLILFTNPKSLHIKSLVVVVPGEVKPAVIVSLLAALLTAATSALVTRCVEQSLWLKLGPRPVKRKITVGESHRLAQWSVSPLARLSYLLHGQSWMLRIGGIFLISTVVISPILLSGISQHDTSRSSITSRPRTQAAFSGFLNTANTLWNGGNFKDVPMSAASVASMSNLSAPAAPGCADPSCSVEAQVASIRADCSFKETDNPNKVGGTSNPATSRTSFCSTLNPNLCRTLVSSNPATYVNFTTGPSGKPGCGSSASSGSCPPGEWSTIFGVWVNDGAGPSGSGPGPIKTVDCALTYGNVTVRQTGNGTPSLERGTFKKSVYNFADYNTGQWRRIYTESTLLNGDPGSTQSPYYFTGAVVPTGANSLFSDPVGPLLLGDHAGNSASTVARTIERNFDMATLFAFARAPNASDKTFTSNSETPVWAYDSKVLLVLIVPFVATLLGVWGRWRVPSKGVNVGYNPVEIARCGPIQFARAEDIKTTAEGKANMRRSKVWGMEVNTMESPHSSGGQTQFVVGTDESL